MLYAEAAYFDGNHCAHCATREEHLRLARISKQSRAAIERRGLHRRTGGRFAHPGRRAA